MNKIEILWWLVHEIPIDLIEVLEWNSNLLEKWNNLTSIARNEWICWLTIVKKEETRIKHLTRFSEELLNWKKRPCCWPWCPHRNSNSKKWFK